MSDTADTSDLILRLARALAIHHALTLGAAVELSEPIPHLCRDSQHPLIERAERWLAANAPELLDAERGAR